MSDLFLKYAGKIALIMQVIKLIAAACGLTTLTGMPIWLALILIFPLFLFLGYVFGKLGLGLGNGWMFELIGQILGAIGVSAFLGVPILVSILFFNWHVILGWLVLVRAANSESDEVNS